jgi:recombination protein RecT
MENQTKTQQPAQGQAAKETKEVAQQLPSQNNTAMKRMQEGTVNSVLERVQTMQEAGEIRLPKDYNAGNALKSAWLYLQTIETRSHQMAIDVCTKESICNCLLEMCIRGEYPRRHCYFIPCGSSLEFWERYLGKYMRAKRDTTIADINAQVVYEGDTFVYTVDADGQYQLVKHETDLANIDMTKIKAAYAVVIDKEGNRHLEIMTRDQVVKAWMQGAAKGNSTAHVNFTDQMFKKTVISRACKVALDTTADADNEEDTMSPPDEAEAARNEAQSPQMIESDGTQKKLTEGIEQEVEWQQADAHEIKPEPAHQPTAKPAQKQCPI